MHMAQLAFAKVGRGEKPKTNPRKEAKRKQVHHEIVLDIGRFAVWCIDIPSAIPAPPKIRRFTCDKLVSRKGIKFDTF